jgi:hypothetical protein
VTEVTAMRRAECVFNAVPNVNCGYFGLDVFELPAQKDMALDGRGKLTAPCGQVGLAPPFGEPSQVAPTVFRRLVS